MYPKTISREEIEKMEIRAFEGEVVLVDNYDCLNTVIQELSKCNEIGFDTETRPSFKKGRVNKVALLQLSTTSKAYLFRLNKIGLPPGLLQILSDERIKKIGVAIHDDLIILKKLKEFVPAGFIELQNLVKEFNIENFGLKNLCGIVLGFRISKAKQLSNWEQEELDSGQRKYAATDAWIPLEIYRKLVNGSNDEGEIDKSI